jgi:hypothetical protein
MYLSRACPAGSPLTHLAWLALVLLATPLPGFAQEGLTYTFSPSVRWIEWDDELVHNWQFSAGLKLLIGRSGLRSGTRVAGTGVPAPAAPERSTPLAPGLSHPIHRPPPPRRKAPL